MKIKISKNIIQFIVIIAVILLDSLFLPIIGENPIFFTIYIITNIIMIFAISYKSTAETCIVLSILLMLYFSYFIELYIHYLGKNVVLEAEFIYLIPLLVACLKIKNKHSKLFLPISLMYLFFNLIILLISEKVDFRNYFLFMVNIITFIGFYYVFNNISVSQKIVDLYKIIFICCFILTIIQTIVGFNTDTRNGVFSVFGWGAYTFFIMVYFLYALKTLLCKEKNILYFLGALLICTLLYICTESKAALIIMMMNIVITLLVSKGISLKKVLILMIAISLVPIAYKVLLKFNPKFAYLNNISAIIRYYTGNNNWRYEYGRFEAIGNVFSDLDGATKIFGLGFGSSTPLYNVFNNELNRTVAYPYYIQKYGYYYGFQHTSSSTILLDGGLILFCIVILFILKNIFSTLKNVRNNPKNTTAVIKFGTLVYFAYYFTYANILKDFRAMAIIGIILGLNEKINCLKEENESIKGEKIDDKDSDSI